MSTGTLPDGTLLRQAARSLYGDNWLSRLTALLNTGASTKPPGDVTTEQVGGWAEGKRRPPVWVLLAMADLIAAQAGDDTGAD